MIAGKWTCNKNKNNMLKHSKMPKHNRFMEYPPRLIANCNRISFLNVKNIVGGGGEIFSRQPGSPPTPPSRPIPPFSPELAPIRDPSKKHVRLFHQFVWGGLFRMVVVGSVGIVSPSPSPPSPPPPTATTRLHVSFLSVKPPFTFKCFIY